MPSTYRVIAASEVDVDSPLTTKLAQAWTDNLLAVGEAATGAPKISFTAMTDAVAGDNIVIDKSESFTTVFGSPTKVWEAVIQSDGSYRCTFDLSVTGAGTAIAAIYKNGALHGTSQSTSTSLSYSEDLAFLKGDLVQVYFNATGAVAPIVTNIALGVDEFRGLFRTL